MVKGRFKNFLTQYCPLTDFKIEKVICNNEEETDFKKYLSINSKGVLESLILSDKDISNCRVYVAAFNGKTWFQN